MPLGVHFYGGIVDKWIFDSETGQSINFGPKAHATPTLDKKRFEKNGWKRVDNFHIAVEPGN